MNRTRLAQLTAVLGAAVLLVLAVAVTRTVPGPETIVAGPALDQLATQAPGEAEPGGEAQEPAAGGETPLMGPTATAPADPVAPGGDGSSTRTAAPDDADTGAASAGTDTTAGPIGGRSPGEGPLPRVSQDPFAPGAPTTSPPAADDPAWVPAPAPGTNGEATRPPATAEPTTTEPTTPAPSGTTVPGGAKATPPRAAEPAPGSTTPTTPTPSAPQAEVEPLQRQVHQVVPGDNLWDIVEAALGPRASNAEVAVAVEELYALNRDVIGDDPDLILPGQVLELPAW